MPAGFRVMGRPVPPKRCAVVVSAWLNFLEQFGLLLILERSSSYMWYEA
jgi:hypothetical protein